MSERHRRGVLWSVLVVLTLSLFIPKGHEAPSDGASAVAFVHGEPGTVTVRLAGDVPRPGVYQVSAPATVGSLVRQAAPGLVERGAAAELAAPLGGGDVVTVTKLPGGRVAVATSAMPARERIVIGIPLDPARMTAADWEALPGIGPALTARIMTRARERGRLRTLDDLRGIDGIGERTIEKLRPLFNGKPD